MREIKFRAWDKEFKRFSEKALNHTIADINFHTDYEWMQYTGLKDKNGKEIFEGDILAINNTRYVVGYRVYSGGWQLEIKNEYCAEMVQGNCELLEIIGNIYENPELLEGTA